MWNRNRNVFTAPSARILALSLRQPSRKSQSTTEQISADVCTMNFIQIKKIKNREKFHLCQQAQCGFHCIEVHKTYFRSTNVQRNSILNFMKIQQTVEPLVWSHKSDGRPHSLHGAFFICKERLTTYIYINLRCTPWFKINFDKLLTEFFCSSYPT